MRHIVGWQRHDTPGMEYAEVGLDPVDLDGEVIFADEGLACVVTYRVMTDASGITTRAVVRLRRAGVISNRTLVRHANGAWTVDERLVPELAGLCDVDLSVTPATNTLPLRRLHLAPGQRQEVTAAWVRFPSLEVVPLRQAYRRVSPAIYDYEAPDLEFRCEIAVDQDGLVETYGDLWTRLAVSTPAGSSPPTMVDPT